MPRQNGKGAVLEAVELAGLFLFGERLILHSAHEFKTASEAFRRIWTLIEQTPELDREVYRKLQNNNDMSIELKSGQRLRFVARSGGSGRGFSGDRVVLDEAYKLPDRAVAALAPTLSARPNPQIWYTSSAPLPNSDSDVLRRICRRGRKGEGRLAYIEFSCADDADPADPDEWRRSNPSLGVVRDDGGGISEDWIANVERGLYTDEDFARERLGIVDLEEGTAYRVIPADAWAATRDPNHTPSGQVAYALDVSPEGRSTAIGVSDGVHGEIVKHAPGTSWVVAACVEKRDRFTEIVLDPAGPAGALVAPLEAAGIPVRQMTTREAVQAAGGFLADVIDGKFRHIGQSELDAAAANADRRVVGDGGWLFSRLRSSVDIAPLVAVCNAKWAAGTGKPTTDPAYYSLDDLLDEE